MLTNAQVFAIFENHSSYQDINATDIDFLANVARDLKDVFDQKFDHY